jgi:hypothetical protein
MVGQVFKPAQAQKGLARAQSPHYTTCIAMSVLNVYLPYVLYTELKPKGYSRLLQLLCSTFQSKTTFKKYFVNLKK